MRKKIVLALICIVCSVFLVPSAVAGPTLVPTYDFNCASCNYNCTLTSTDYNNYKACKDECTQKYGTCAIFPVTPGTCVQCVNQCNDLTDRQEFLMCREKCSLNFKKSCKDSTSWTPVTCQDCYNGCQGLSEPDKDTCMHSCNSKFGNTSCPFQVTTSSPLLTNKLTLKPLTMKPLTLKLPKTPVKILTPTKNNLVPAGKSLDPGIPTDIPTTNPINNCPGCMYDCTITSTDYTSYKACKDECTQKYGTCTIFPVTPGTCVQCVNQCNDLTDRQEFLMCREKCSSNFGESCSDSPGWIPVTCQDCYSGCNGLMGSDKLECENSCISKFGLPSCPAFDSLLTIAPVTKNQKIFLATPTIQGLPKWTPAPPTPQTIMTINTISTWDMRGDRMVQTQNLNVMSTTSAARSFNQGLNTGSFVTSPPLVNNINLGKIGPVFMSNVTTGNITRNVTPVVVKTTVMKK